MIRNLFGGYNDCRTFDICDVFGDNSGVVLYRLDGNANDESGNYHGTETAITYGGGAYGRGAVFNGTSSKIGSTVPASLFTITNNFTVSAWVKTASAVPAAGFNIMSNVSGIATSYYGFGLSFLSSGIAYGFVNISNGGRPIYDFVPTVGTWYHVLLTFDGTSKTSKLFVNGVQVATDTNTNIASPTQTLDIGYFRMDNSAWFKGSIDQVRILNRALTADEVATLYAECAPTSIVDNINPFGDGSLKALYKFDGDATDATGIYNGTATNVTYGTGKFGQCAVFNGSSYISTSFALSANVFSYSVWATVTTVGTAVQSLIDFTTNRGMLSSGNGTNSYVSYYDGGSYRTFGAYSLPSNTRVLLTLVVNGTTAYLYADGVLKGSSACTAITPSGGMYLGRYAGSSAGFLTGNIDQVRIFNKALTPMEVAALYTETTPLEEPMSALVDPFKDGNGVALYRLEGNALDESGNYNGTAYNLTYGTGLDWQAGVFNGSNSYVQIGAGLSAFKLNNHTMSCWVKINAYTAGTQNFIFNNHTVYSGPGNSYNSGSALVILDGYPAVVYVVLNTESVTNSLGVASTSYNVINRSDVRLNIGEWYHITGVVAGGNSSKLYLNGQFVSEIATTQSIRYSTTNDNVSIGVNKLDASFFYYLNGSIDEVRFFKRALTPAEVLSLYNNQA